MKSNRGMSLILVMVGLSIVSVILLAVFKLLDMSRDMAASLQDVIKSMDAMQEVRFAMADVATCTFNFRGLAPGSHTQPTEVPSVLEFARDATTPAPLPGPGPGPGPSGQVGQGSEGVPGNPSPAPFSPPGPGPSPGPTATEPSPGPSPGPIVQGLIDTNVQVITFGGLGETSVEVSRVTISQRNPPIPNAAEINVEMMLRGRRAGQRLKTRSVPVWIRTDGAGRITCCNTRSLALCP